jgi:hypothetical protein
MILKPDYIVRQKDLTVNETNWHLNASVSEVSIFSFLVMINENVSPSQ